MLYIPKKLSIKRKHINIDKKKLINFESIVKDYYNLGKIRGPVHLSSGNENYLLKIFKYIDSNDWVCSNWRNHFHALLHGIPSEEIFKQIIIGTSMSTNYHNPKFLSSSIVAGSLSIALGLAIAAKKKKSRNKVWCFIGDMTFETGFFHEVYKYSRNFKLPLEFVIEDNGKSTNTPTKVAWGRKKLNYPKDVIYYKYKLNYPHHGTGKWVAF